MMLNCMYINKLITYILLDFVYSFLTNKNGSGTQFSKLTKCSVIFIKKLYVKVNKLLLFFSYYYIIILFINVSDLTNYLIRLFMQDR